LHALAAPGSIIWHLCSRFPFPSVDRYPLDDHHASNRSGDAITLTDDYALVERLISVLFTSAWQI